MPPASTRRKQTRKSTAPDAQPSPAPTTRRAPARGTPAAAPQDVKEEPSPGSSDSRKRKRATNEAERRLPQWTPDDSPVRRDDLPAHRTPSPAAATTAPPAEHEPAPPPLSGAESEPDDDGTLPDIPGYTVHSLLGTGSFSRTYLCTPTTPNTPPRVAIKRYNPRHAALGHSEISILRTLPPHRHLIPFHGSLPLPTPHLLLTPLHPSPPTLPTCPHTPAHGSFSCPARLHALAKIMSQLLSALHHLHSHSLIHADVTPSNLLLRAPPSLALTLTDLSNTITPAHLPLYRAGDDLQTPCYRAPEILLGSHAPSAKIDVFSAGVIGVELLLAGEVVGCGVEGAELLHAEVEDRDGLCRRVCELLGADVGRLQGRWWRSVYADITARWRWEGGRRVRVGEKRGILRERLDAAGEVGAWLGGLLEVLPERRVGAREALRGGWLVRELLGGWGEVLMGAEAEQVPGDAREEEIAQDDGEDEDEEDISFV